MSEGIFGKNADLAQRLKDRIAFHANEHRHTYEIGKGVMDALVLDLLADFRDAGGVILPAKPNGTVWLIRTPPRRVGDRHVRRSGSGRPGRPSVLRGRSTTAWSSEQFTEHDIGKTVFLTKKRPKRPWKAAEHGNSKGPCRVCLRQTGRKSPDS